MNRDEKLPSPSPDLLGRFSPSPRKAYLRLQHGQYALLETNDSQFIALAVVAGAAIARVGSPVTTRWKLLRDWRQPIRPIHPCCILQSASVTHVSFGSGSWLAIDSELKEAFGFFGREMTKDVLTNRVFPMLMQRSSRVPRAVVCSSVEAEVLIRSTV